VIYSVQCAVCSVRCTVYGVQWTVYGALLSNPEAGPSVSGNVSFIEQ
jgi:hypothetical protein